MLFEIEPVILFKKDASGALRTWSISVCDDELVIQHGLLTGALTETREEILIGKGGRSAYQQRLSRFNSRINKQKLKGYKETIEEAQDNKSNSLGLVQPMLAQRLDKVKNINFNDAYVQYKYDGNRCLITNQNGKLTAYSRRGKIINSVSHILDNMQIPEGITIDGELYAHGNRLQDIRSWIAREQKQSLNLNFHAYDIISDDVYSERLRFLTSLDCNFGLYAGVVPTRKLEDPETIPEMRKEAILAGYEGLIIRLDGYGYEPDKRSKSLLKVKQFMDDEFEVTNIYMSDKGMPMATCRTDKDKYFDVVLPGTHVEKHNIYHNKNKYIGLLLTVEYSQMTADNIPFHGIAKDWRSVSIE